MKNPQAFPSVVPQGLVNGVNDGMTLRDYFAAAALQGFCANPAYANEPSAPFESWSYGIADKMLEQRTKNETTTTNH